MYIKCKGAFEKKQEEWDLNKFPIVMEGFLKGRVDTFSLSFDVEFLLWYVANKPIESFMRLETEICRKGLIGRRPRRDSAVNGRFPSFKDE